MIRKAILTITFLTISLQANAANPPSLIQPKVFEPVIKLFISVAIMFGTMLFIVALIAKRFNPKYKDSSILSLMINLWLNNKQKREKEEGTIETYSEEYPYESRRLLEKSEKDFFKTLEIAILNKYYIFPQVGLSRIIDVPQNTYNRQGHLNRIDKKSVDYVICDKENFSNLLVIELDGTSHNSEKQKEKDEVKEEALKKSGIHLLRQITQKTYNPQELKRKLSEYLPGLETTSTNGKICTAPGCYGIMQIRTGKDGKQYWVCSEYNKCKTAVMVEEAGA